MTRDETIKEIRERYDFIIDTLYQAYLRSEDYDPEEKIGETIDEINGLFDSLD